MKKIIVSALAIASLVACTKEEIVKVQAPFAIEYEGAYVDPQTRAAVDPSTTTATIAAFNAYGFMDEPAGVVFNAEDVTKVGGQWSYANTQYWMPGHHYYFAALAPMDSQNWKLTATGNNLKGAGVVEFTNVDGTEDLLYAAADVETSDKITEQPAPVKFAFSHLLSKVKFTFTNGFTTENMSVVVTNVKMTAPKSGKIDLDVENWWDNDDWKLDAGNVELAFGDVETLTMGASAEVANERLTIPASKDQVYDITFDVEVFVGEVSAIKTTRTAQVTGVALEMGKAYNFQATLEHSNVFDEVTLYPITFEVTEVKEWVNAETPDKNVQEAELLAAAQLGGSVKLAQDMELSKPLIVTSNFNLDLNGFTFKAGTPYVDGSNMKGADISAIVVDGGSLTISGDGKVEGATYGVYAKNGTLTIMGGEYTAETSAVQVANATVNIFGGKFSATDSDKRYVINCIDANYNNGTAKVSVMGGVFADFNPADNASEGLHTNYVPCGYASTAAGSNFTVKAATVKVSGEFKDQTIEVTYAPENNASTYGVVCPEGDTKISNVTINGNGFQTTNGKGLRAIYITKGGDYEFDNVTAVNVTYAINVNTTQPVSLTVKNSTLEGWTSYGYSTSASFENVKFTCGKYANFKPYTKVILERCDFADGFKIDVTAMEEGGYVHLVNCTYKGVAISASNMPAIDGDASMVSNEGIF